MVIDATEIDGSGAALRRPRRGTTLNFDKLSKSDLKRAFILKEVLDRPVSERDPLTDLQTT
jgi:hypothetical protein